MLRRVVLALACLIPLGAQAQHAGIFLNQQEAEAIRSAQGRYSLMDHSLALAAATMKNAFAQPLEVPPPGEAGGYEHERHKQNYREMRLAGLLFAITQEERYATFVRDMLELYAEMYPTLGPHPLAHHQRPGKIFHQTLNEEVWLVHTSVAYDCVYTWLSEEERERFEANIFRPMADWFSVQNESEFNRIHNHGTWAVAAVGMIGYVMGDLSLVEKALHGSRLDGQGGFLKQLDLLFSPDGYYMEGPYYIRYALMPFFYFAEAVERMQPEQEIYGYRDQILRKAYYAAVQTAFPNGIFPPINDASLTMDVAAPEVVLANALTYDRYGADDILLGVSRFQGRVPLSGGGLVLARDYDASEHEPVMSWPSLELRDGYDGLRGGLGMLRTGDGESQSMLLMKYGVHGSGHGHFDKLHFIFFDQGRQVIRDYGFGRWINVEPKFGGRYLPENDSYAMQTVAHNTVVVDATTQNGFDEDAAEATSGQRHFFDSSDPAAQIVSARADTYYDGVEMQRTMLLLRHESVRWPVVLDLFRLTSDSAHKYDYPLHYRGQLISTNLDLETHTTALTPLGEDYGYQHIWKTAEAATDSTIRISWLDGSRYYSAIGAGAAGTIAILGRTGANDPDFNLRSEPLIMLRRRGADHLFVTAIVPHGYFNEARERSDGARPEIVDVRVAGHNDDGSVIEVIGIQGLLWRVMVTNHQPADSTRTHTLTLDGVTHEWTGTHHVETFRY